MIDPNIKKKADDIRNKVYGKEVRESLASGLESLSSDVVENEDRQSVVEGRQDSVESQWQSVIDETTNLDVVSAPEIIAARDGEVNLKSRLDKEHVIFTTQLAQTGELLKNTWFLVTPEFTQEQIQLVLDEYNYIRFSEGDYFVELMTGGHAFDIKSNTTIVFDKNATIRLNTSNTTHYQIFQIRRRENIVINGVKIVGDRETNTSSGGEWGMGIEIIASHNIEIRNSHVSNCWGDGLYIGSRSDGAGGRDHPSNIRVFDSTFDNNRRQGTSIISGKNLLFERCEFTNTQGTLPESGIDIEPNNQETVENVSIIDCLFKGNGTYSITTKVDFDSHLKGMTVRGCQLLDDRQPNMRLHGSGTGIFSDVVIEQNMFNRRLNLGSTDSEPITLSRVHVLNNTIPNMSVRNISDFVIEGNTMGGQHSGGLPATAFNLYENISNGQINNNNIVQVNAGIIASENADVNRLHLTNNVIEDVRAGNALTLSEQSRNWIVSGNGFYNIVLENGVEVNGRSNHISNNSFITVREGRAVKLNETSSFNLVTNNLTLDTTSYGSNPILDNGTDNIVDVLE